MLPRSLQVPPCLHSSCPVRSGGRRLPRAQGSTLSAGSRQPARQHSARKEAPRVRTCVVASTRAFNPAPPPPGTAAPGIAHEHVTLPGTHSSGGPSAHSKSGHPGQTPSARQFPGNPRSSQAPSFWWSRGTLSQGPGAGRPCGSPQHAAAQTCFPVSVTDCRDLCMPGTQHDRYLQEYWLVSPATGHAGSTHWYTEQTLTSSNWALRQEKG